MGEGSLIFLKVFLEGDDVAGVFSNHFFDYFSIIESAKQPYKTNSVLKLNKIDLSSALHCFFLHHNIIGVTRNVRIV